MMLPATDRSYDTFWRQAVRWLALAGRGSGHADASRVRRRPGDDMPLARRGARRRVRAADRRHGRRACHGAGRHRSSRSPAGCRMRRRGDGRSSRTSGRSSAGVYRVTAEVRQDGTAPAFATASVLVGGADIEMTDPRLNVACSSASRAASGGRVHRAGDIAALPGRSVRAVPGRVIVVAPRSLAHRLVVCRDRAAAGGRVAAAPAVGAAMRPAGVARRPVAGARRCARRLSPSAPRAAQERYALIVSGATGGPSYAQQYTAWTDDSDDGAGRADEVRPARIVSAVRDAGPGAGGDRRQRPPRSRDAARRRHDARRSAVRRADRPRHVRRRRREVQPRRTRPGIGGVGGAACAACPAGSSSSTRRRRAFRSSSG